MLPSFLESRRHADPTPHRHGMMAGLETFPARWAGMPRQEANPCRGGGLIARLSAGLLRKASADPPTSSRAIEVGSGTATVVLPVNWSDGVPVPDRVIIVKFVRLYGSVALLMVRVGAVPLVEKLPGVVHEHQELARKFRGVQGIARVVIADEVPGRASGGAERIRRAADEELRAPRGEGEVVRRDEDLNRPRPLHSAGDVQRGDPVGRPAGRCYSSPQGW